MILIGEHEKQKTPEEKYDEARMELAVYRLLRQECGAAEEALSPAAEREVEHQAQEAATRILSRVNRQLRREHMRVRGLQQARRVLKTAVIAAMLLCTLFTATLLSDAEMRASAARYFGAFRPRYDNVSPGDTTGWAEVPEGWRADYYPSFFPDGFSLRRCVYDSMAQGRPCRAEYSDEAGQVIEIEIWKGDIGKPERVDAAQRFEISLHGTTAAVLTRADGSCFIVWSMDNCSFAVYAEPGFELAQAIAASMAVIP